MTIAIKLAKSEKDKDKEPSSKTPIKKRQDRPFLPSGNNENWNDAETCAGSGVSLTCSSNGESSTKKVCPDSMSGTVASSLSYEDSSHEIPLLAEECPIDH